MWVPRSRIIMGHPHRKSLIVVSRSIMLEYGLQIRIKGGSIESYTDVLESHDAEHIGDLLIGILLGINLIIFTL